MQNYSLLFPHCPSTCKTGGLNSSGVLVQIADAVFTVICTMLYQSVFEKSFPPQFREEMW